MKTIKQENTLTAKVCKLVSSHVLLRISCYMEHAQRAPDPCSWVIEAGGKGIVIHLVVQSIIACFTIRRLVDVPRSPSESINLGARDTAEVRLHLADTRTR